MTDCRLLYFDGGAVRVYGRPSGGMSNRVFKGAEGRKNAALGFGSPSAGVSRHDNPLSLSRAVLKEKLGALLAAEDVRGVADTLTKDSREVMAIPEANLGCHLFDRKVGHRE